MPTRWECLYDHFDAVVRSTSATTFARLASHDELRCFGGTQALYAYLIERACDLDARDAVLAALVSAARAEETRALATALLWLALWPGLCGVYRRRSRWGDHADEVVSVIGYAFTALVAEMDLARVHRVAATLVRSTERDVVAALRPRVSEVPFLEVHADGLEAPRFVLEHELRLAHRWLLRAVGPDADLVFAVAVLDESQGEAAARVGTTAVAARKRYQRAIARVRETYAREAAA